MVGKYLRLKTFQNKLRLRVRLTLCLSVPFLVIAIVFLIGALVIIREHQFIVIMRAREQHYRARLGFVAIMVPIGLEVAQLYTKTYGIQID